MKFDFDFDVKWTLISRAWMILAGFVTVLLLPLYLDATEQGYYFTFLSILTLQIFFELGLNQIIVQFVSHETADRLDGQADSTRKFYIPSLRLMLLVQSLRRWYRFLAGLFALLVIPVGWMFFSQDTSTNSADWLPIWIIIVIATCLNLYFSAFLAACEGFGKVGEVSRLRFFQNLIGYIIFWLALKYDFGLMSICVVPTVNAFFSSVWLSKQEWLRHTGEDEGPFIPINWKKDIFPLQWRMAVSWISGYFIYNLFVPLTFAIQGAVEAGKLGIALAIFNSISTLGLSLVNAKFPLMGKFIASNNRVMLNHLFKSISIKSLIINMMLCAAFVFFVWFLSNGWSYIIDRMADLEILIILSVAVIINTFISSMALYMRAHKQEPMLLVSIVMGAVVSIGSYYAIKVSVFAMLSIYLSCIVLISLPWTLYLWSGYRRRLK